MKIVIHQPEYLPWYNLFFKLVKADSFVILDDVQYMRRGFQNRNQVLCRQAPAWLTVPIKKSPQSEIIKNIAIDNSREWKKEHVDKIRDAYSGTKYFNEFSNKIFDVINQDYSRLIDLNMSSLRQLIRILQIDIDIVFSSDLNVPGKKSDRILNLCLHMGAKEYVTGIGSKDYLDEKSFSDNHIDIQYCPPSNNEYSQVDNGFNFVPHLSIIDTIFNVGIDGFYRFLNNA